MRRGALAAWLTISIGPVSAQVIDSLRIFTAIPAASYTTSLAETTGWRLMHTRASCVSIGPGELADLNAGLQEHRPVKHTHSDLPTLSHIGFIYYDKRAHVFCLSQEDGLVVDLTARRQFRLEDWTERVKLKAVLMALGL